MTSIIKHEKYSSFLLLIFSLIIGSLISCSEQGEVSSQTSAGPAESRPEYAKDTASAEDHPDHAKVAAPVENYPEYAEDTAPVENYREYEKDAVPAESFPEYAEAAAPVENYPEYAEAAAPAEIISNKLDEYKVVLGADKKIQIPGFPGELRVWIGSSSLTPNFPERMAQDETKIAAVGESARVEPFAPAFKIDPEKTQCIKIHPSGSEVRFTLTPKKSGVFDVGANVYLFDSPDCTGSPIPKTAATLKVTVEVDEKGIFLEKAEDLWNIFWEQLLKFWKAFIALIFALILFLIRGKLKQWFGFEKK